MPSLSVYNYKEQQWDAKPCPLTCTNSEWVNQERKQFRNRHCLLKANTSTVNPYIFAYLILS